MSKPKRFVWRVKQKAAAPPPPPPPPPWVELPREITADILRRLGIVEILLNAERVCSTWWNVCHDPSMWRVIDMRDDDDMYMEDVFDKLCRIAVDRSQVAKNFPLLEELHIYLSAISKVDIEVVGRSCSQLKSFTLNDSGFRGLAGFRRLQIDVNDQAMAIAVNMPELRHLALFGNTMTNEGLSAILDGCPRLQSLDLRHCYSIDLKGDLGTRCHQQIIDLKCPHDCTRGYEFSAQICDYNSGDDESDGLSDYYEYEYDYDYDDFDYDDFTNPFNGEYLDEDGFF
ncbi:putative 60S ribosomal protein L32-1-like, partial [Capsicum annuum]